MEFLVNPTDPYYKTFFSEKWTPEMIKKIFPPKSVAKELLTAVKALTYIAATNIKCKFIRQHMKAVKK